MEPMNSTKSNLKCMMAGLAAITLLPSASAFSQSKSNVKLPNILWITSEDNSPLLGCYGDKFATTPNLDKMASVGFRYTHVYANCPVCAPSRNTIITGVFAASNGNEHMRSTYKKSEIVKTYSELMREAGYYCTNNSKTDYNCSNIDPNQVWDESSAKAHYKNRPAGKPFFAVFNLMISHESQIQVWTPTEQLRHKPEGVVLPPYHPDTKEMRHDWAQYYDKVEDMDTQVGKLLAELEESGEAENTIVFYYSDHGGVLARSKRYIFETGTWVPFILRIPEKYKYLYPTEKPGSTVDRMISFVDLAPTLLTIAQAPAPDYLQGNSFLGEKLPAGKEYVHMTRARMDERIDMCRAVRDKKFRYIRNYMPFRIYLQHLDYLFQAASAQSWEDAYFANKCNETQSVPFRTKSVEELYDTENDPYEVNNLANDPKYQDVLKRMRKENYNWMAQIKDVGLIPESEYLKRSGNASMYDYMRSASCPFNELLDAAELATLPEANIAAYKKLLKNKDSAIRYWGVTGLLIHKDKAKQAIAELKTALNDESSSVATLAAETMVELGEKGLANQAYLRILSDPNYKMPDRNFALNSIDAINFKSPEIVDSVKKLKEEKGSQLQGMDRFNVFDVLMASTLLKKWGK